jgi:hypothetical protein
MYYHFLIFHTLYLILFMYLFTLGNTHLLLMFVTTLTYITLTTNACY